MRPLPGQEALDRYYLEARSKLLDVAAILDRIDRGGAPTDAKLERLRQALALLQEAGPDRAEKLQHLFSLPYDPAWGPPKVP